MVTINVMVAAVVISERLSIVTPNAHSSIIVLSTKSMWMNCCHRHASNWLSGIEIVNSSKYPKPNQIPIKFSLATPLVQPLSHCIVLVSIDFALEKNWRKKNEIWILLPYFTWMNETEKPQQFFRTFRSGSVNRHSGDILSPQRHMKWDIFHLNVVSLQQHITNDRNT